MDFGPVTESLRAELDTKMTARESALASSRNAIRACGNAIRALHRHEFDTVTKLLDDAESELDEAREALTRHPDMLHAGFVHDAEKEFAEARITSALVNEEELPSIENLKVSAQAYLKGMAESIGELRRHILDLMRHGELERCEKLLGAMDDMYYVLVSMDYPDGITYGLRRLTDIARSIIERTRGDFTTSMIQSSLRTALEQRQTDIDRP